jgi:hypothetical protein
LNSNWSESDMDRACVDELREPRSRRQAEAHFI